MRRACIFCKKYGATIGELAEKLKVSTATIQNYHNQGFLDDFIKSGKKPIARCEYRKKYGFSITEIEEMLKKDKAWISHLHHSGKLKNLLNVPKFSK